MLHLLFLSDKEDKDYVIYSPSQWITPDTVLSYTSSWSFGRQQAEKLLGKKTFRLVTQS